MINGVVRFSKVWAIPKDTIAAGYRHTVGLKSDGTVTAVGDNKYGQCDVSGWRDMVAVAAGNAHTGNSHTIGLKSDGTVAAVGCYKDDQCDVSGGRDIVAVAAGWRRTVGLKSDGTVVAVGRNNEGQCNVSAGVIWWRLRRVIGIPSG
jgi:alpha-tubulin suppressor-like RCC1 family protein